jgi:hypothetical protein
MRPAKRPGQIPVGVVILRDRDPAVVPSMRATWQKGKEEVSHYGRVKAGSPPSASHATEQQSHRVEGYRPDFQSLKVLYTNNLW